MTRTGSNGRKGDAKSLAAATGLPLSEARRQLATRQGPRTARARLAPTPQDGQHPRRAPFLATVDSRPLHGDISDARSLRTCLSWAGWQTPDGTNLDTLFPAGGTQTVVRTEEGQEMDQVDAIWRPTGLIRGLASDESATPYASAVADALTRAGFDVADWDCSPDEDRRIYITFAAPASERADVLGWIDTRSTWFTMVEPRPGEALGDYTGDLDCAWMATPDEVVQALLHRTTPRPGRGHAAPGPTWQPPEDYQRYPAPFSYFGISLPLERALAAYTQHPAWEAHQAAIRARAATTPLTHLWHWVCWHCGRSGRDSAGLDAATHTADDGIRRWRPWCEHCIATSSTARSEDARRRARALDRAVLAGLPVA